MRMAGKRCITCMCIFWEDGPSGRWWLGLNAIQRGYDEEENGRTGQTPHAAALGREAPGQEALGQRRQVHARGQGAGNFPPDSAQCAATRALPCARSVSPGVLARV